MAAAENLRFRLEAPPSARRRAFKPDSPAGSRGGMRIPMAFASPLQLSVAGSLMFSAGGLYGWSAVIPAIQSAFHSSAEQAGMVFSFAIVAFSASVFAVPRTGGRLAGMRGGGFIGAAGALFLAISVYSTSYPMFLAAFGVGFGAASGGIYIVALDVAGRARTPWLMVPVMIAAFGLGGAVFGPLMRLLVEAGAGLASLAAIAAPLLLASVVALGAGGAATAEIEELGDAAAGGFAGNRLRIALVWLIFCLGSMAGLMVLGLASSIVETKGAPVLLSSAILTGIAIGNTAGRLAVGALVRLVLPRSIIAVATAIIAIGIVIAWQSPNPMLVGGGLVVIAAGYGLVASGIPTLTGAMFGAERLGRVFSVVFSAWGVAGLTAPWLAGRLFDRQGDYGWAFLLAMSATVSALLLSLAFAKQLAGSRDFR